MKHTYYAIQLEDDSYAMLEQRDHNYVEVYSTKDISCATFYSEDNIEEGFQDLKMEKTKTIEFIFLADHKPVGITRVRMEIDDKVDINDFR